jgi:hypothetical protein
VSAIVVANARAMNTSVCTVRRVSTGVLARTVCDRVDTQTTVSPPIDINPNGNYHASYTGLTVRDRVCARARSLTHERAG